MDASRPYFSLVIPTKDRPEILFYCLKCILEQTFTDFEIIISDNGIEKTAEEIVAKFVNEPRVKYFRPPVHLNMSDNWEYALQFANGEYVSVVCEKFMFIPTALETLYNHTQLKRYGIVSWQFDRFEQSSHSQEGEPLGHYHPLMKPYQATEYSALDELKRRFSLAESLFYRESLHKVSYGKAYSGMVHRRVLEKVKSEFGRVFHHCAPDFSSMCCFLNVADSCLDLGRPIMISIFNKDISNGAQTKVSARSTKEFLHTYFPSLNDMAPRLLFNGLWFGHTALVTSDYNYLQSKAHSGLLKQVNINRGNTLAWMYLEHLQIEDSQAVDYNFEILFKNHKKALTNQEVDDYNQVIVTKVIKACQFEIYHSGLQIHDDLPENISAAMLAKMHWHEKLAPPRKNIIVRPSSITDAVRFLHDYQDSSLELLGIAK